MAPIRVGLIGASAQFNPLASGAWAGMAHVPFLSDSSKYTIAALANSSIESANASITAHGLPSTTKAYGNPEDLANDPEIDLIVVSVRVQKHFLLTKPALLQKKAVFVEWPLGATLKEAEELTALAIENGLKTVVGLQSRADPLVWKLKQILSEGQIGVVTSSSVIGSSRALPLDTWPEGSEYYLDMKSGGNEFYILFAHFLDAFVDVLGEFTDLQSVLKTQDAIIPIASLDGKIVDPAYHKTAPDHILVQGNLASGAVASLSFRKPVSSVDNTAIRWLITGTKGELEITTPQRQWQFADQNKTLRIKVGLNGDTCDVDWGYKKAEARMGVSPIALNTALVYDSYANGDTSQYATFESALKTHRLLNEIVRKAGFKY